MPRRRQRRPGRGFTAVEMLVILAILGILMSMGIPIFVNVIHQTKMFGLINKTGSMYRLARAEAVKRRENVVVRYDFNFRRIEVFADIDGPAAGDPPDGIFNPVGTEPAGRTDYWLGSFGLPAGIDVAAPGSQDLIDGFTTVDNAGTLEDVAIFIPDGSIAQVGAPRLADTQGNYFEVRVSPQATARIFTQKWDAAQSEWFEKGEDGNDWEWY